MPPRFSALCICLAGALLAGACRRVPLPPYPLAFAVDGRAPRVLQTSQEAAVPLVVANAGKRAWDPARIHVSYHWLWLVPRELAARSRWDVPYHDGIRTELAAPVSPGARVDVQGRLLAPAVPGLYWLQWDMVEEGVTWFAQVSPRQPRQLVLVVPTPAGLFAPLPLIVAVAGLLALSRVRRGAFAATADVWWCAAALFSKQLLLVPEAVLEPTAVAYWLTAAAAAAVPIAAMLLFPRRVRAWVLFGVGALGAFVVCADIVYYRFFGDLLSAPAVLAAHQTGQVLGSVRSLITPNLLWLVVDLPFALWLVSRVDGAPDWTRRRQRVAALAAAAALVAIGAGLGAPQALAATRLDQMFRNRAVVEQLGPFGFHAYDAWNYVRATTLRPKPTADQIDRARRWFASRAPLRAGSGPLFGAARGRNLIVVQVESLQDFMVDYVVDGQDVMPHLRRWTDDSLRFTNVADQTNEGRTSDAEFTALVSLLPLDHGAVAFRYPGNHYVALPSVLVEHGYATLSAVAFEPGFWNRRVMHPSYGFQQSLFEPDFTMTEQIGWGLNDHDFLQQMVPHLEKLPRPFCAWVITLSLHHPFDDFPERHKVLRLGALEQTSFGNYLHTMRFFDQALEDFKASLARDGLLETSMLVVFGDHDAGFPRSPGTDEAAWTLNDRVPLFIRLPNANGVDSQPRFSLPAGQTDFAPTMLALLGIDPAPLPYSGRNLLGRPDNPPVVRPYGDWLDAEHLFLSHSAGRAPACYALAQRAYEDAGRCADADARARETRDVSRFVVAEDLQQRLR